MSLAVFYTVTYLPIAAWLTSAVLLGVGIYLRVKKRPCKKPFIGAAAAFVIPVALWAVLFALAGFVGIGPGLGE